MSRPLARPRLFALLANGAGCRLTTVVAPAGYGKTTLLADWAGSAPVAWHTCTQEDRDPRPAMDHLARALRTALPGLDFTLPAAAGDPHAITATLCEAIGPAELTLVLDDVHVVAERDASARLLEALCRQLPPAVRLILSSRRPPPFPVQRLRDDGQLVELTAGELAFTAAEVAALLTARLGLAETWAARIHQATGGWPIAVRLAAEALRHGHVADPPHRPGALFDYVATEIVDREPEPTRECIRAAAVFDRFRPELLAALGHPAAVEITEDLVGRGLFVESLPSAPGWFGLVPLAREFVRTRLPLPDNDVQALYDRAAHWFEANGHLDAALSVLAERRDTDRLRHLLDTRGNDVLRQGGADAVIAAVRLVPTYARSRRTWQLAGEAYQVRGDRDQALECLQRTVEHGQPLLADVARRIAWLHYMSGEPAEALDVGRRCVLDGSAPAAESLLLSCVASAHWARGDLDACRTAASDAFVLARTCGDDVALAAAHTVLAMLATARGDRTALTEHNREGLRHAERAGDVQSIIRIRSNRASHHVEEGDYRAALAELEIALPLADLTGFATYRAFCLNNRGEARLRLGQLDEATADLVAARNIFSAMDSRLAAVPLTLLAETYRHRGDRVLAETAYRQAIRLAEVNNTVTQLVPALAGLARLLVDDDPETSADLVDRALSLGTGYGHSATLIAAAELGIRRSDGVAALHSATEAEVIARTRGDDATLAEALELQGLALSRLRPGDDRALSLVDSAASIWRKLGNESRLTAVRGTTSGRRPPPLAIQTLGGFRVLRDGEPVPLTAWQSKKARDLVKILVSYRGRPVTREALCCLLWPDVPARRVGNRLSVALSTARGVLGSQRGAEEQCLITDGDSVRLDPAVAAVDVLTFLAGAHRGLRAWRDESPHAWSLLSTVEGSYTGDYLEEDPYEDWASELREEARLIYVQVATALAGYSASCGEHVVASRYCLRVLERDQYNEPAHLALVAALVAAGSHGEARRRYRTYVTRMSDIDVEPRPFP